MGQAPNGRREGRLLPWAAAGALLAALPAQAGQTPEDSPHWARSASLAIRIADNLSPAWASALRAAAGDWGSAPTLATIVVAGGKDPVQCIPTFGRVELCGAAFGRTGWLALAQVWTLNGHVVQASARLNDSYFEQSRFDTPGWRRFAICRQIGHALGLDGAGAGSGSCMDGAATGPGGRERPGPADHRRLEALHQHSDSGQLTSTRSTAQANASSIFERPAASGLTHRLGLEPGEWGKAVARDSSGRTRHFVRKLGAGVEVSTFVLRAPPAQPGVVHAPRPAGRDE